MKTNTNVEIGTDTDTVELGTGSSQMVPHVDVSVFTPSEFRVLVYTISGRRA